MSEGLAATGRAERQELFSEWLAQHQGIVIKVARSFTTEPQDTDDLIQEILLRIWISLDRYRGEAKVSTWLYRVALNRALTWQRDGAKRRTDQPLLVELHDRAGPQDNEEATQLAHLYQQIRRLSPIDRSLMLLSLDGLSYAEMAEVTGISLSNVGARLSRARTKLSTFVEEQQ